MCQASIRVHNLNRRRRDAKEAKGVRDGAYSPTFSASRCPGHDDGRGATGVGSLGLWLVLGRLLRLVRMLGVALMDLGGAYRAIPLSSIGSLTKRAGLKSPALIKLAGPLVGAGLFALLPFSGGGRGRPRARGRGRRKPRRTAAPSTRTRYPSRALRRTRGRRARSRRTGWRTAGTSGRC
jgi:hypothetical protein